LTQRVPAQARQIAPQKGTQGTFQLIVLASQSIVLAAEHIQRVLQRRQLHLGLLRTLALRDGFGLDAAAFRLGVLGPQSLSIRGSYQFRVPCRERTQIIP
jgi:hypothetical protein